MKSKLKILVVFVVMFFASFVPESNHELFGDWKCRGGVVELKNDDVIHDGCQYYSNTHGSSWHWGMRHWIWLLAGVTFSIWTVVDVIAEENK
jgi:hypothetical protein